jgi:hypothetical protein
MNRRLFISLLASLPALRAYADSTAYSGVHEAKATRDSLTFHHRHDWSSPKVRPMFLDLSHHDRFLSAANDFSFVELLDGDRVLFRSPAPALSYLWISPDARFFVGLSDIKLYNPYQLMVWKRDGSILHREHICAQVAKLTAVQKQEFATRFPEAARFLADRYVTHRGATYLDFAILGVPDVIGEGAWKFLVAFMTAHPYGADFRESVTNNIEWFDAKRPEMNIERRGGGLTLSLRSPSGNPVVVSLQQDAQGANTDLER